MGDYLLYCDDVVGVITQLQGGRAVDRRLICFDGKGKEEEREWGEEWEEE